MHASLLKAKLCEQRSQFDAALQIYQGLLRLMPSHPRVNSLKGALLIQMGRPAQAIQPLQTALTQEPQNAQLWLQLVAALYRSGRVGQARQLMALGQGMGNCMEPDLFDDQVLFGEFSDRIRNYRHGAVSLHHPQGGLTRPMLCQSLKALRQLCNQPTFHSLCRQV